MGAKTYQHEKPTVFSESMENAGGEAKGSRFKEKGGGKQMVVGVSGRS